MGQSLNRQEQICPSLAKGWATPQEINGMFCNCDPACCRLYRLFSTLMPVVGFTTCSQLCPLLSALTPVLGFVACPQLCCLSSTLAPVLSFHACSRLSPPAWRNRTQLFSCSVSWSKQGKDYWRQHSALLQPDAFKLWLHAFLQRCDRI